MFLTLAWEISSVLPQGDPKSVLMSLYFIRWTQISEEHWLSRLQKQWRTGKVPTMFSHFRWVQSLSRVQLFATPWTAAQWASLSINNSWGLLKVMYIKSAMPSNHLILCVPFSSHLQSFPASGSFQMSQFFASGGQSTGVSALASFLPKKSQGWSPSEWAGWISLQSKGLQESSPTPHFKSINSSALSLLHSPTLTSIHHSLD